MPVTAVCECGKSYNLKDEFAGQSVKCPSCQATFVVPASRRVAQADPIYDHDKFLVRQKKIAISHKYYVGDEQDRPLAFVHRPAMLGRFLLILFVSFVWVGVCIAAATALFPKGPGRNAESEMMAVAMPIAIIGGIVMISIFLAPKRHVAFYRDVQMRDKLLTVRQNFKFSVVNATYTLLDAGGTPLAVFRKNYLYNIFRRRWYVDSPDGTPIAVALEDSILLSMLRRFFGPLFGLLRTNFMIMSPDFSDVLGELNRKLTLFDKYVLDLTHDPDRLLDRRIALALGVMLDTGEHR